MLRDISITILFITHTYIHTYTHTHTLVSSPLLSPYGRKGKATNAAVQVHPVARDIGAGSGGDKQNRTHRHHYYPSPRGEGEAGEFRADYFTVERMVYVYAVSLT